MGKDRAYLTREGYEKLREELEHLKKVRRPQLSKDIEVARAHGDLSENADYDAAKEALTKLQRRIADTENKLRTATIVDDAAIPTDKVYINAKVTLKDMEEGDEFEYTLVGADEADPVEGKISVFSPIGQGLLEHKAGDVVEIKVPKGTVKYKILKIER